MSRISDEKLLYHLKAGLSELTPDRADEIWEQNTAPADGTEWYLDRDLGRDRRTVQRRYRLAVIAACLVLCLVSGMFFHFMPSASVYLDVNPGIALYVNYRDRVTRAEACNKDAVSLMENMDLNGVDLDVALYAILGSMVQHGYLTEAKDTVLVSVHSANAGRADELERKVSGVVSRDLNQILQTGEVLSQQVGNTGPLPDAGDHNGSPGKAAFIEDLQETYPQLEQEALEELTVDEIVSLLVEEQLDYSAYTDKVRGDNDDDGDDDDDDDDEDDSDDDDTDDDDEDD